MISNILNSIRNFKSYLFLFLSLYSRASSWVRSNRKYGWLD